MTAVLVLCGAAIGLAMWELRAEWRDRAYRRDLVKRWDAFIERELP